MRAFSQVIEQREWKDFDWKRHSVFCSFGLFYLVSPMQPGELQIETYGGLHGAHTTLFFHRVVSSTTCTTTSSSNGVLLSPIVLAMQHQLP
jgi:hypothetical protein